MSPVFVPRLAVYGIDDATCQDVSPDGEGRVTVTATCQSLEDARAKVLALGRAV